MLRIKQIKPKALQARIVLPASKSIANRMLMIQALAGNVEAPDLSVGSHDVRLLYKALTATEGTVDFEDAGTPLRLFIAYAALKGSALIITGNARLKERPLKPLLQALESLGAKFEHIEQPDMLPLKVVQAVDRSKSEVTVVASLSSQFISALMLIGPYFEQGLDIHIRGDLRSAPYVFMTQDCMEHAGAEVEADEEEISIASGGYRSGMASLTEGDWSSACFIFAWVALSQQAKVLIPYLKRESSQGDSIAVFMFKALGVDARFTGEGLELSKGPLERDAPVFDLQDVPDMFPVLVALCAIRKLKAVFMGVSNLRHKESDRIEAMRDNLLQCGVLLKDIETDTVELAYEGEASAAYAFKACNDHRIAMACSLFAFEKDIQIDDATVVRKSFPDYWEQMKQVLGAELEFA